MLTSVEQRSVGVCAAWAGSSPFAQQQGLPSVAPGSASPPVSSNSAGTAAPVTSTGSQSSSPTGSSAETPYSAPAAQQQQQQQGYASLMAGTAPKRFSAARFIQDKEWLYRLITFPSYFTPCPSCCGGARMPKREQLMTHFDTEYPYRVYCSHCPECKDRINSGYLLQVRRSAFKDVVKATDIQRFGADVAGVQQYTLNGSKVIYLNREQTPEKKGNNTNAAPAACSVDGRAMMDKSSSYCSLKCKLIAEDPGFTSWLDLQDPSVRILAQAAANAPPRPTAASKRTSQPTSSAGSGGSGACSPMCDGGSGVTSSFSRPVKCARTLGSSAMADSAAAAGGRPPSSLPLQRSVTAAPTSGTPAGLKRIRISMPANKRQTSAAPSGPLEAALVGAEPAVAAGSSAAAAAAMASGSWLDLDNALSCSTGWDSWDLDASLDSPCFTAVAGPEHEPNQKKQRVLDVLENDGSMSPALIHAPTAFSSGSCDDWWLCGSPLDGAFTSAGMGALLNSEASRPDGCGFGGLDSLSGVMLLPPVGPAASRPNSQLQETSPAGLPCC